MNKGLKVAILSFLGVLMVVSAGFSRTLLPLPYEIGILPDFPNMAVVEYYDISQQSMNTALTTDLISWKCLTAIGGWSSDKNRWVLGTSLDVKDLFHDLGKYNILGSTLLDSMPITIKLLGTYGLDTELNKRDWRIGVGINGLDIRNKN